jgi:FHA domain-containing protein
MSGRSSGNHWGVSSMDHQLNSHPTPESDESPREPRKFSFLKGLFERPPHDTPANAPTEQAPEVSPRSSTFVISGPQMQARMINVATHMHNAPGPTAASDNASQAAAHAPDHMSWMLGVSEPVVKEPVTYRRMPTGAPVDVAVAGQQTWTVELHSMRQKGTMIALELVGDAIIGRSSEADLDLDVELGPETTVSRRHAMLRPTPAALYLIDLGSTNGSQCNGVPLIKEIPTALYHGDVISFGLHTLTVKIVSRPHSLVL